jgi:predicted short-subunit dehydrogenase-like oxidoreductase (DUF2520 family)
MLSVFILGNGRMAKHLASAFQQTDVQIAGVYARDETKGSSFAKQFNVPFYSSIAAVPVQCDVYFLALSDQAIVGISEQLKVQGLVVHCSGMLSKFVLQKQNHFGVFWPIQSFSENLNVDFKSVPICIEGNTDENTRILEALADRITNNVQILNENQRQQLHLAAVVVNNFTNHLYVLADSFLKSNQLSFNLLKPLIIETAHKIINLEPHLAQTGPANRNDINTIEMHQKILAHNPELLHVYQILSNSIILHSNKNMEDCL